MEEDIGLVGTDDPIRFTQQLWRRIRRWLTQHYPLQSDLKCEFVFLILGVSVQLSLSFFLYLAHKYSVNKLKSTTLSKFIFFFFFFGIYSLIYS